MSSINGSVIKVKATGNWRARYRDKRGKTHSQTFKLKGHADAWLRDELAAMHSDAPVVQDHITLDTYVTKWLKRVALDVRPTTFDTYSTYYRVHIKPTLGKTEFRDLTSEDVRDWFDTLRTTKRHGKKDSPALSRATCAKTYKLLKRICSDAVDDGYLLAPGALFHASRTPSTLMRINFASTQEATFWRRFEQVRDTLARAA